MTMSTRIGWVILLVVIVVVACVVFAKERQKSVSSALGIELQKVIVDFHRNMKNITTSCLPGVKIFWFDDSWAWIAPDDAEFPKYMGDLNAEKFVKIIASYPQKQLDDFSWDCQDIVKAGKENEYEGEAQKVIRNIAKRQVTYHIENGTFKRFLDNGLIVQKNPPTEEFLYKFVIIKL